MFEDKAGFEPEEFVEIYAYLTSSEFLKPDPLWKVTL